MQKNKTIKQTNFICWNTNTKTTFLKAKVIVVLSLKQLEKL